MKNVPNILSVIRIALVGVFLTFYLRGHLTEALIVYVVAAVTDFFDGYIARKYNFITDIGKLIDPLADKLMTIAAIYCLYDYGVLEDFFLYIIIGKELLMVAGGIFFYRRKKVVYAQFIGKIATFMFNLGIGLAILCGLLEKLNVYVAWLNTVSLYILWAALVVTIAAFVNYVAALVKGSYKKNEELGIRSEE